MILVALIVRVDFQDFIPGLESRPPREIPVAVVGPKPEVSIVRDALNGPSSHPFAATINPSRENAMNDLADRKVSAVLVLGDDGKHELLTSSATNPLESKRVSTEAKKILALSGQSVRVSDVNPNGANDPRGAGATRLGAGWVVLGVILAGLLGLVFGARSKAKRLVRLRFVGLGVGAITAGVFGAILSEFVYGKLHAPVIELAVLGSLVVAAVGAVTMALIAWFGAFGLVLAATVMIGMGLPGAIGVWPLSSMDSVWSTTLAWLPPGASAWAIRGLAYFDGRGIERVVVMMIGWLVIGYLLTLLAVKTNDDDPRFHRFHPDLRRAPFVSAFFGMMLFGILVIIPASPSFSRTELAPALSVKCEPFKPPETVAELNKMINSHRSLTGFVGGDLGASAQVADGRSLFVFGDTIRQSDYSSRKMVRNSMLVFGGDCAGAVLRRDRGPVIPDRADGVGYWPMSIASVEMDGYNVVGVMAQRVKQTSDGIFGFENLGPTLAIFRVDPGEPPVLQRVVDIGPDNPDTSTPVWGAASTVVGDTVYLYGTSREEGGGFGWALSVARVKLEDIGDPSAWEYFDGESWQDDPARAAKIIDQDNGVSQTLSVFKQGDSWYALSKRADFIGTDLVVWKAPSPTGPFVASRPVADIPSTAKVMRYSPLAHPELLPKPGTMVVSVSRNSSDSGAIAAEPGLYRPEFIRVKLP